MVLDKQQQTTWRFWKKEEITSASIGFIFSQLNTFFPLQQPRFVTLNVVEMKVAMLRRQVMTRCFWSRSSFPFDTLICVQ